MISIRLCHLYRRLSYFTGFFALFATGDARPYPFVFQCFSEPVDVIAPVPEQSVDIRQTAE